MVAPSKHCVVYRDAMCGMLHCVHYNEKLMFWKEALAYTMPETHVVVNGSRHDCMGAILDVGLNQPDPGMVPDGAKCGNRQVSVHGNTTIYGCIILCPCTCGLLCYGRYVSITNVKPLMHCKYLNVLTAMDEE